MTAGHIDNGRGLHPAFRSSTHRFWSFDDEDQSIAEEHIAGDDLTQLNSEALPYRVPSWVGFRCLRGVEADSRVIAGSSAASASVLLGNWTVTCWLRIRSLPAGSRTVWAFGGDLGSSTEANNALARLLFTTTGQLGSFWEHSAGTTVQHSFTTAEPLTLNEWTMVTLRKHDGAVSGKAVDLFINGMLVETTADITNATGGGSGKWTVCGHETSGGVAGGEGDVDVASLVVYEAELTNAEIADDYRRAYGLGFDFHGGSRVEMLNGTTNSLVDLSEIVHRDWLDAVTITDPGGDEPVKNGSISVIRDVGNLSLAPLRDDGPSEANVINQNRTVVVFMGRAPLNIILEPQDCREVFRGKVRGKLGWNDDRIEVPILDQSADLVDLGFIETERDYGSAGGVAVETIMQSILDDNDDSAGTPDAYAAVTLSTPVSPSWLIKPYTQQRETVLQALRTLAQMIGWEVGYRWDSDPTAPGFKLTFFEPQRLKDHPDFAFSLDDLYALGVLSLDDTNVRTAFRGVYRSSETTLPTKPSLSGTGLAYSVDDQGWVDLDGQGNRTNAYLALEATAQRGALGRRFMEMQEDAASQIDTITEMSRMLIAAARDLSDPELEASMESPLMYEATSQSLILLLASFLYANSQTPAAISVTSSTGGGKPARTELSARGKPSLGPRRWLELEAKPGGPKPPVIDLTRTTTNSVDGDLLAAIDTALERSGLLQSGKYLRIPNADFSTWSAGGQNPPTGWAVAAGAWATDAVRSTTTKSGGFSVEFDDSTTALELESKLVEIEGDDVNVPYSFEMVWQRGSSSAKVPELTVDWIEEDRATSAGSTTLKPGSGMPSAPSNNASEWFKARVDGVHPPSGAKFMRVTISTDGLGAASTITVDSVAAYRTSRASRVELTSADIGVYGTTTSASTTAECQPFGDTSSNESFDYGNQVVDDSNNGSPNNGYHWLARDEGSAEVDITGWMRALSGGTHTTKLKVRLVKNATYTSAGTVNTAGTVIDEQTRAIDFVSGVGQDPIKLTTVTKVDVGDRLSVEVAWISGTNDAYYLGVGPNGARGTNFSVKMRGLD